MNHSITYVKKNNFYFINVNMIILTVCHLCNVKDDLGIQNFDPNDQATEQ